MCQIAVGFDGIENSLPGRHVTARGLHSLFFHILRRNDHSGVGWSHKHASSKPYNLVPFYEGETGVLTGLRLGALIERLAELILTYAPSRLSIPGDWLDCCRQGIFVKAHRIETAEITIVHNLPPFIGFVGDVLFKAKSNSLLYQSLPQGLAGLTAFFGMGHKITMGMGP